MGAAPVGVQAGWYSPSASPGEYCELDAEPVTVVEGAVTSAIDIGLDPASSIGGTVCATLTIRGVMEHPDSVRRSFVADDDLAATLSTGYLGLFDIADPDEP